VHHTPSALLHQSESKRDKLKQENSEQKKYKEVLRKRPPARMSTAEEALVTRTYKKVKPGAGIPDNKISSLLSQLTSTVKEDVETNADLLGEVLKSFASSFKVQLNELVSMISEETGNVNMESIRQKLLRMILN